MKYELIRSRRKTLAVEIREGRLVIRAPYEAGAADIEAFLARHRRWIEKHLKQAAEAAQVPALSEAELKNLAEQALRVIPERTAYYAQKIGVTYGRITIRAQRTRWGSCSQKGNLNFNCLLMLAPPEVLDSVIVHELCHRKEMNHSQAFYREVYRVCPEYDRWHAWLKEHGAALVARLP